MVRIIVKFNKYLEVEKCNNNILKIKNIIKEMNENIIPVNEVLKIIYKTFDYNHVYIPKKDLIALGYGHFDARDNEWFKKDLLNALNNINNYIKPGKKIILSFPNPYPVLKWVRESIISQGGLK